MEKISKIKEETQTRRKYLIHLTPLIFRVFFKSKDNVKKKKKMSYKVGKAITDKGLVSRICKEL